MKKLGTFMFCLALSPGLVFALDPGAIQKNQSYWVTESIIPRTSPPKSFYRLGDRLKGNKISKGTKIDVLEVLRRDTLLGTSFWYKVKPENDNATNDQFELWIYGGKEGKQSILDNLGDAGDLK